MNYEEILDTMTEALKQVLKDIMLPTGQSLLPTFAISLVITLLSTIVTLLDMKPLIDWRGSALASVLLAVLCFIERRGENEISRLYRTAQSGIETLKERGKSSGSREQTDGDSADCSSSELPAGDVSEYGDRPFYDA